MWMCFFTSPFTDFRQERIRESVDPAITKKTCGCTSLSIRSMGGGAWGNWFERWRESWPLGSMRAPWAGAWNAALVPCWLIEELKNQAFGERLPRNPESQRPGESFADFWSSVIQRHSAGRTWHTHLSEENCLITHDKGNSPHSTPASALALLPGGVSLYFPASNNDLQFGGKKHQPRSLLDKGQALYFVVPEACHACSPALSLPVAQWAPTLTGSCYIILHGNAGL